ncbi:MAG: hypothetical protein LBF25_01715, partial [Puniceicoccales bacterium]|nr:hypothetical protein [Puniceicoccales bacterium]
MKESGKLRGGMKISQGDQLGEIMVRIGWKGNDGHHAFTLKGCLRSVGRAMGNMGGRFAAMGRTTKVGALSLSLLCTASMLSSPELKADPTPGLQEDGSLLIQTK